MHGGSVWLGLSNNAAQLTVSDSAFDGTLITTNPANGSGTFSDSYNAYLTNATKLPSEISDPAAQSNFNWQVGPLGNYYLPSNSPLIDAGNEAASGIQDLTGYAVRDLGIFTTQNNQVPENAKNPAANMDIGYHHAAPLQASPISDQPCVNSSGSSQFWDFQFSTYNDNWDTNTLDWWALPVTYSVAGFPQHGHLTNGVNQEEYIYTPNQCYEGPDSFTYQMSDGLFTSPPATVSVLVADVIGASYRPAPLQTLVNTPTNITLIGSDSCGQGMSFSWPSKTSQGGALSGTGANLTYYPPTNFGGIDSFEFQVVNQCGYSAGAIVYITVGTNSGAGGPFTVVTNLNGSGPIGIDYSPTQHALVVSVDNGNPDFQYDDFVQLGTNAAGALTATNFSGVSSLSDEVKLVTVKQSVNSFTNGDVYFGSDTGIGWIAANGTSSNLDWCILTNNTVTNALLLRGSLYVDQTAIFSNNIIAVTSSSTPGLGNKGVWVVDAQAHPTLLAQIDTDHLEGVITLSNDTNKWGPWAGKIISGDEDENRLYTIDISGNVTSYNLGIASEDFDLIPTNEDLYVCDDANSRILKLSHTWLTNYVGDLLITQAGDGAYGDARLFILNWNGTNFVTRSIAGNDFGLYHCEHVSFAPLDLPSKPIQ